MRRTVLLGATGAAMAVTAAGCSLLTGIGGCKTFAAPSFSVSVRDSVTKVPIAFGARLEWTGPVSGSAEIHWTDPLPPDPSVDSLSIVGPFEESGRFDLTVRKSGYRDWHGRVTVKEDGCHVKPVSVTALLQRIMP